MSLEYGICQTHLKRCIINVFGCNLGGKGSVVDGNF